VLVIVVEKTGPLATLQDLGRPGLANLGVPPSGAADRGAHRLANRLVGNDEGAATIESTLGGLVIRTDHLVWVAVTGPATQLLVNDRPTASHLALALAAGDRLTVQPPPQGLRNYLAVRGGFDVPPILGSRSTDVLSELGPAPLRPGTTLRVGHVHGPMPGVEQAPPRPRLTRLEVTSGPRRDWFADRAWQALTSAPWTVTPNSNRVAVRLDGPLLERTVTEELPSEGLIRGAVQVPLSGQPMVFLADHPVTGGYPVIAVLSDRACDDAAQLRPGDQVRFSGVVRVSR
jgi:biotin-dependent carboxylase-like uncharacterized protein